MGKQQLSTAEQLELHSLVALVKSAKDKQAQGKPLTKKEIAAVAELERRRDAEAKPATELDPLAIVRMIVLLEPAVCNEEAIRAALGNASVSSLPQIADAFGVSHATVKHTWRANGMPGDGRRRSFPLAEVLIWFLKRNIANVTARGADEYTSRKRDAETRAAEAEARIKEHKADVASGGHILMAVAVAVVRARANMLRDQLMGISRKFKSTFPGLEGDLDREHRSVLIAFEEGSIYDLEDVSQERMNDDV